MLPVIRKHSHLLGIVIDESTALVVRRNTAEVIGKSKALFYDIAMEKTLGEKFYISLDPGEHFNLESRRKLPAK